MIVRTIGRLILVPVAYCLASVTAAFIAVTLGLEKITVAMSGKEGGAETVAAFWELVMQGGALIMGLTMLPSLAVVLIGEIARIRSWLYYMVGGGLALGLLPLLAKASAAGGAAQLPPEAVWQVLATAGFAGGLVYWLVAGRTA